MIQSQMNGIKMMMEQLSGFLSVIVISEALFFSIHSSSQTLIIALFTWNQCDFT